MRSPSLYRGLQGLIRSILGGLLLFLFLVQVQIGPLCQGNAVQGFIEVCDGEIFNATCPQNKVIRIDSASYGRMNIGRCVQLNYGHLGCAMDVAEHLKERCSGRQHCSFIVPDDTFDELQPCTPDLVSYLEVRYSCVPSIRGLIDICDGEIFSPVCREYEVIRIDNARYGRMRLGRCVKTDYGFLGCSMNVVHYLKEICSGRQHCNFQAQNNTFNGAQPCPADLASYLEVDYSCVRDEGCPDLNLADDMTVRYGVKRINATVKCSFSTDSWQLRCIGNQWVGEIGNCSAPLIPSSATSRVSREFCNMETVNIICPENEVIALHRANYGRMRRGRCVKVNYGHVGCHLSVNQYLNGRCSGRQHCRFKVSRYTFGGMRPCAPDLVSYLRVDYSCVAALGCPKLNLTDNVTVYFWPMSGTALVWCKDSGAMPIRYLKCIDNQWVGDVIDCSAPPIPPPAALRGFREYCDEKIFNANCLQNKIIRINHAYGRMRLGRCVKEIYGYSGCTENVDEYLIETCSGNQRCSWKNPNRTFDSMDPCMEDLSAYLEIHDSCSASDESEGYYCDGEIFNVACGENEVIRIDRALYGRMDFGRCVKTDYGHLGCSTDVVQYLNDRCSGRQQCRVKVQNDTFDGLERCPNHLATYLEVDFSCVTEWGCPDLNLTDDMTVYFWLKKETALVQCKDSAASWQLNCIDNQWVGEVGNCSGSPIPSSATSNVSREFCNRETVNIICPQSEVIVVHRANYGVMRRGRCVRYYFGYMGCSVSVDEYLNERCSGRQRCSFNVSRNTFDGIQPCAPELISYLDVNYSCVTDVGCPELNLLDDMTVRYGEKRSNATVQCKASTDTWQLKCIASQWVGEVGNCSAPLIPSSASSSGLIEFCDGEILNAACKENEVIRINSAHYGRMKSGRCLKAEHGRFGCSMDAVQYLNEICSGRQHCRFQAQNNTFNRVQPCPRNLAAYLEVDFSCVKAVGCPDLNLTDDMTVRYGKQRNNAKVQCKASAASWQLKCIGNQWVGKVGNCSVPLIPSSAALRVFRDSCEGEIFNATCPENEVIRINYASYGRLRLSRCVKANYGHLGCTAGVDKYLIERCSGRQHCSFVVPDDTFFGLNPCIKDLVTYLGVDYSCVAAAGLRDYCDGETFNVVCRENEVIRINSARYGRMRFGRCVKEDHGHLGCAGNVVRYLNETCSGRQHCKFEVKNNTFDGLERCPNHLPAFLEVDYSCVTDVGCPDLNLTDDMTVRFWLKRENALVRCKDGTASWQLKCIDNQWDGEVGICPGSLIPSSATSNVSREFCNMETLNIICRENEVIVVHRANYGRMRDCRCVIAGIGFMGCSVDVLRLLDEKCSGRQHCRFKVLRNTFGGIQPCAPDFVSYLEVEYSCVAAVGCPDLNLTDDMTVRYGEKKSNATVQCKDSTASWQLRCIDNQWVGNVGDCSATLIPSSAALRGLIDYCEGEIFNATCPENEVIRINSASYGRMRVGRCVKENYDYLRCTVSVDEYLIERCSGRRHCSFIVPDDTFAGTNPCSEDLVSYLEVDYSCVAGADVGCPDLNLTDDMTVYFWEKRENALVRCKDSTASWQLKCINNQWDGEVGICPGPLIPSSATSNVSREFCNMETVNIICRENEVIVIHRANYGRMRIGKCVTGNYGYLGCTNDVVPHLDERCSGRQHCRFKVSRNTFGGIQPCSPDVVSYLEVGYSCVTVADECPDLNLPDDMSVRYGEKRSNATVQCKASSTSWQLQCIENQWVGKVGNCSAPLIPSSAALRGSRELCDGEIFNVTCPKNEVIRVNSARYGRMRLGRCVKTDYGHLGCTANADQYMDERCSGRQHCRFTVSVDTFGGLQPCPRDLASYLEIDYSCGTAVRCPDLNLTDDMTVRYGERRPTATVQCRFSTDSWELRCIDNQWVGKVGNCSAPLIPSSAASRFFREFCNKETLNIICQENEVIVVNHALYGRMKLGRCVRTNYGYLGCKVDVLRLLDEKCSGRQHCRFKVPDNTLYGMRPCPPDFASYLEVGYSCVAVAAADRSQCVAHQPLKLTSSPGYISTILSEERKLGGKNCPWSIVGQRGQTINITVYKFVIFDISSVDGTAENDTTLSSNQGRNTRLNLCCEIAILTDLVSNRTLTVCDSDARESSVIGTKSHQLQLELINQGMIKTLGGSFLIHYVFIGCPELNLTDDMTVRYGKKRNNATVKCKDSTASWQLKCVENQWVGDVGDCSAPLIPSSAALRGFREFCDGEIFNVTCLKNEVIRIVHALYGRMRLGRCVKADYGHLGCTMNADHYLNERCSGRQHCSFIVPDDTFDGIRPCPTDLVSYLEVYYSCVAGSTVAEECPDLNLTDDMIVRYGKQRNNATVQCTASAASWQIKCIDNQWVGKVGNCSAPSIPSSAASKVSIETCNMETLHVICRENEVIVIDHARYGRMRLGRCVRADFGYLGCSADALRLLDEKCSGRQHCRFKVPDNTLYGMRPCPPDFASYLDVGYSCVAVAAADRSQCVAHQPLKLLNSPGYISNILAEERGLGGKNCPWSIVGQRGQTINITLYNFGYTDSYRTDGAAANGTTRSINHGRNTRPDLCFEIAVLTDLVSRRALTVCDSDARESSVIGTKSHQLQLELTNQRIIKNLGGSFLIHYVFIGCPELKLGDDVTVRYGEKRNNATVQCNASAVSWQLKCIGNHWVGKAGNCSASLSSSSAASGEDEDSKSVNATGAAEESFPYGLLLAVSLGVTIGVLLGGFLLCVVTTYAKRWLNRIKGKRREDVMKVKREASTMKTISNNNVYTCY